MPTYYSHKKLPGFTAFQLKIIAMVTMVIDHLAIVFIIPLMTSSPDLPFLPQVYFCFRFIGRLSFPLFAFLLAEGFIHTSSRRKYAVRLGVLAVISEIPFNMLISGRLWDIEFQNIFFTLLIGLLTLIAMEKWRKRTIFQILAVAVGMVVSWEIKSDYCFWGVAFIAAMYQLRNKKEERLIIGSIILICMIQATFEVGYLLVFFLIGRYNGRQGMKTGYFPYIFYPLHMIVLTAVKMAINI